jgi:hypothetical protein
MNPEGSSFSHIAFLASPMTTILIMVLIVLLGSAILGFRGYWS